MKKIYFFLFALLSVSHFYAQNFCEDADSYLVYAFSNAKRSFESNNIQHVKHYSEKSLKSLEKAKFNLKKCGDNTSYELAYDGIEILEKVEYQDKYEEAVFFAKKAKGIIENCMDALSNYTYAETSDDDSEITKQQIETANIEKRKIINTYEEILLSNINSFNEILKRCGSTSILESENIDKDKLEDKSAVEIKTYYMERITELTNSYLTELKNI